MEKLILRDACYKGIEGVQTKHQIFTPEHKQLVKQANEKREERHRRDLEVLEGAKLEIFGQ